VFEGTPRLPLQPSRPLGSSNDEIFGEWLGHSEQELSAWKRGGVIGYSEDERAVKAESVI
jgi:CoA:oxalate CoA-transferase